jgi:RNase P/RNase MRP subunit p29
VNVIGEKVSVASSRDPTKVGASGVVLVETAKTLYIDTGAKKLTVEKAGQVFVLSRTGEVVIGDQLMGRPEDRIGARKK